MGVVNTNWTPADLKETSVKDSSNNIATTSVVDGKIIKSQDKLTYTNQWVSPPWNGNAFVTHIVSSFTPSSINDDYICMFVNGGTRIDILSNDTGDLISSITTTTISQAGTIKTKDGNTLIIIRCVSLESGHDDIYQLYDVEGNLKWTSSGLAYYASTLKYIDNEYIYVFDGPCGIGCIDISTGNATMYYETYNDYENGGSNYTFTVYNYHVDDSTINKYIINTPDSVNILSVINATTGIKIFDGTIDLDDGVRISNIAVCSSAGYIFVFDTAHILHIGYIDMANSAITFEINVPLLYVFCSPIDSDLIYSYTASQFGKLNNEDLENIVIDMNDISSLGTKGYMVTAKDSGDVNLYISTSDFRIAKYIENVTSGDAINSTLKKISDNNKVLRTTDSMLKDYLTIENTVEELSPLTDNVDILEDIAESTPALLEMQAYHDPTSRDVSVNSEMVVDKGGNVYIIVGGKLIIMDKYYNIISTSNFSRSDAAYEFKLIYHEYTSIVYSFAKGNTSASLRKIYSDISYTNATNMSNDIYIHDVIPSPVDEYVYIVFGTSATEITGIYKCTFDDTEIAECFTVNIISTFTIDTTSGDYYTALTFDGDGNATLMLSGGYIWKFNTTDCTISGLDFVHYSFIYNNDSVNKIIFMGMDNDSVYNYIIDEPTGITRTTNTSESDIQILEEHDTIYYDRPNNIFVYGKYIGTGLQYILTFVDANTFEKINEITVDIGVFGESTDSYVYRATYDYSHTTGILNILYGFTDNSTDTFSVHKYTVEPGTRLYDMITDINKRSLDNENGLAELNDEFEISKGILQSNIYANTDNIAVLMNTTSSLENTVDTVKDNIPTINKVADYIDDRYKNSYSLSGKDDTANCTCMATDISGNIYMYKDDTGIYIYDKNLNIIEENYLGYAMGNEQMIASKNKNIVYTNFVYAEAGANPILSCLEPTGYKSYCICSPDDNNLGNFNYMVIDEDNGVCYFLQDNILYKHTLPTTNDIVWSPIWSATVLTEYSNPTLVYTYNSIIVSDEGILYYINPDDGSISSQITFTELTSMNAVECTESDIIIGKLGTATYLIDINTQNLVGMIPIGSSTGWYYDRPTDTLVVSRLFTQSSYEDADENEVIIFKNDIYLYDPTTFNVKTDPITINSVSEYPSHYEITEHTTGNLTNNIVYVYNDVIDNVDGIYNSSDLLTVDTNPTSTILGAYDDLVEHVEEVNPLIPKLNSLDIQTNKTMYKQFTIKLYDDINITNISTYGEYICITDDKNIIYVLSSIGTVLWTFDTTKYIENASLTSIVLDYDTSALSGYFVCCGFDSGELMCISVFSSEPVWIQKHYNTKITKVIDAYDIVICTDKFVTGISKRDGSITWTVTEHTDTVSDICTGIATTVYSIGADGMLYYISYKGAVLDEFIVDTPEVVSNAQIVYGSKTEVHIITGTNQYRVIKFDGDGETGAMHTEMWGPKCATANKFITGDDSLYALYTLNTSGFERYVNLVKIGDADGVLYKNQLSTTEGGVKLYSRGTSDVVYVITENGYIIAYSAQPIGRVLDNVPIITESISDLYKLVGDVNTALEELIQISQ